jgi:hypothetical protein
MVSASEETASKAFSRIADQIKSAGRSKPIDALQRNVVLRYAHLVDEADMVSRATTVTRLFQSPASVAYRANLKYESAQSSMVMTAVRSKIEQKKELVSQLVKQ